MAKKKRAANKSQNKKRAKRKKAPRAMDPEQAQELLSQAPDDLLKPVRMDEAISKLKPIISKMEPPWMLAFFTMDGDEIRLWVESPGFPSEDFERMIQELEIKLYESQGSQPPSSQAPGEY